MSYLERLDAKSAMKAEAEPAKGAKGGFDPFEGDPRGLVPELPAACVDGLRRLRAMPTPRILQPDLWPMAVSDALGLARDGWAAKAMALGWTELDIFGAVTDPDGDPIADGLAVKLAGRRVLAMSATSATIADGSGGRIWHYRRGADGAVLLWDMGREPVPGGPA